MPYNFVADSFHTNQLCSRLFRANCDLHGKRPFCVLRPYGGLGATYDDRLRLIGKRVVDFLIELFC